MVEILIIPLSLLISTAEQLLWVFLLRFITPKTSASCPNLSQWVKLLVYTTLHYGTRIVRKGKRQHSSILVEWRNTFQILNADSRTHSSSCTIFGKVLPVPWLIELVRERRPSVISRSECTKLSPLPFRTLNCRIRGIPTRMDIQSPVYSSLVTVLLLYHVPPYSPGTYCLFSHFQNLVVSVAYNTTNAGQDDNAIQRKEGAKERIPQLTEMENLTCILSFSCYVMTSFEHCFV